MSGWRRRDRGQRGLHHLAEEGGGSMLATIALINVKCE